MNRIRVKVETRRAIPRESRDSWAAQEWVPPGEEPAETDHEESQYETVIVDGGMNVDDIQTYIGVRDDRVGVFFKNGVLLSIVSSLEEFEHKLEQAGI